MPCTWTSHRPMPRRRLCRRPTSLFFALPLQALRRVGTTKNWRNASISLHPARWRVDWWMRDHESYFCRATRCSTGTNRVFQRTGSPAPGRSTDSSRQRQNRNSPPLGSAASIVRLSKVLRSDDRLFTGWINDLNQKKNITAFADHHLAPISLAETIEALLAISQSPDSGLFQMSGARDISSFDAACRLASLTNADPTLVVATKAAENGVPANEIIHNSTLDSSRITALTGWTPRDPLSVIDEVFRDKTGRSAAANRL